jgi:glycosyltransferase involved in cell wall biosynthesis
MKIGISTSVIGRGQAGIGQYLLALLRPLMRYSRQHEFTLFVLEEDVPLFEFVSQKMHVVPVPEKFRPPVKDILWHQTQLPALAHQHHLDVLHVPSYRRMLWLRPCALVTTIHDLAPFHLVGKYDRLRMLYAKSIAPLLARRQHEIITVSETTANDVIKYFKVPRKQLTIIPNGVDHERFSPVDPEVAKATAMARFGLSQPYFLYVARLEHPAKNHVRLITAFNKFKAETLSPWQLVLAGGDWHGAGAVHLARQQSAFTEDIHCLGFVPDEDLPTLYRGAEVFVYPSLYEGFGLPPIEAMACGCPVICSKAGSLSEITGNAADLVNPEDTEELKLRMIKMFKQPEWREQWRAAGKTHAQRYQWHRAAAATMEIYRQAVTNVNLAAPSPTVVNHTGHR